MILTLDKANQNEFCLHLCSLNRIFAKGTKITENLMNI